MTRKLSLNPDVSYMLGVYSASKDEIGDIGVRTGKADIVVRFAKIAIENLGIEANSIKLKDNVVYFHNQKIKRMFDNALERRTKTFKYINDYSGSYIAGIFDCNGGFDKKGMYIRNLDNNDFLVLENLGIHLKHQGSKSYIMNEKKLVELIKRHSLVLH